MTKNTKIALGCGGAGCLGLVLIVIIGVVLVSTGWVKAPSNDNSNRNLNSNSKSSSSSSTMSEDAKHRLFQAVGATKDDDLLMKVLAKTGFPNASGVGYDKFMEDHLTWAMKNFEFMGTVDTAEKGRAYVNGHIND
ncbi:MAG: hypothetical protein M3R69_01940 [Acidobacteriota bacterium]|nr:hypothetical protein [Acidobacteriota bacterium]